MKNIQSLTDDEFSLQVQRAVQALPDAPAAWQRSAVGLWRSTVIKAGVQEVVRRLAAVLSFDSWAAPATAMGMRSVRSPTRHLLFTSQGRDIDLRIAPAVKAYSVVGQILGPDDTGIVELSIEDGDGRAAHITHLDPLGEFAIHGVRSGTYVMTLHVGIDQIVLPAVEVGEPLN